MVNFNTSNLDVSQGNLFIDAETKRARSNDFKVWDQVMQKDVRDRLNNLVSKIICVCRGIAIGGVILLTSSVLLGVILPNMSQNLMYGGCFLGMFIMAVFGLSALSSSKERDRAVAAAVEETFQKSVQMEDY